MKFSKRFYNDAMSTWEAISPDIGELLLAEPYADHNIIAWELVLDADRLATYGSRASNEELKTMMKEPDIYWTDVLEHCAKEYPLI